MSWRWLIAYARDQWLTAMLSLFFMLVMGLLGLRIADVDQAPWQVQLVLFLWLGYLGLVVPRAARRAWMYLRGPRSTDVLANMHAEGVALRNRGFAASAPAQFAPWHDEWEAWDKRVLAELQRVRVPPGDIGVSDARCGAAARLRGSRLDQ
jgi:hypothetical protein